MKLQKATMFALYAVLELAIDPERQLSAGDIASKYGISTNHLAKVMRDLGRAGLVEATRGVGGGYRFCGNAKRTTLLGVIELFENISAGGNGAEPEVTIAISRYLSSVLAEIEKIARATLDSITIETLVMQIRRRAEDNPTERARGPRRQMVAPLKRSS